MKRFISIILFAIIIFSFASTALAASPQPSASATQITTAAASRQDEVLKAPSGSVTPQPPMQTPGIINGTLVQYIITGAAIAVVVILLVVFRRKYKNRD